MDHTITKEQLPRHTCGTIDEALTSHFLQTGKGKWKKILVIGESLALDGRVLSGKAFYTQNGRLVPSGKRFNELFAPFGCAIEDVSFTELCKCVLGKDRHLLVSCAPKCRAHLRRQIAEVAPALIIILGKHTLDILKESMQQDIPLGVLSEQQIEGNVYTFLPIYHPSPINPKSKALNQAIIEKNERGLTEIFAGI